MKDEFIRIYQENIKREGADKLLDWLLKSDFFTAPASTKYHGAYEGGLVLHSVNVFNRLAANPEVEENMESVAIAGLLHDLCKVDFYATSTRNVKDEATGTWTKVPYYTVDDKLPYGHGEKSVYIISGFMRLSREEAMAIRWHMGGFEDNTRGGFTSSLAFDEYPLAVHLHIADLQATFIDEKRH